jgi:uncharacterized membrane protein YdbT with pleckstrin-like domain
MNTQTQEKSVTQEATPQSENHTQEKVPHDKATQKRTWVEEVEVAGSQLVEHVKALVQENGTKRVIIRSDDNKEIFSVPLTTGVVVGGIITLALPVLAAVGTVAALVSKAKLEVIREEAVAEKKPASEKK